MAFHNKPLGQQHSIAYRRTCRLPPPSLGDTLQSGVAAEEVVQASRLGTAGGL